MNFWDEKKQKDYFKNFPFIMLSLKTQGLNIYQT